MTNMEIAAILYVAAGLVVSAFLARAHERPLAKPWIWLVSLVLWPIFAFIMLRLEWRLRRLQGELERAVRDRHLTATEAVRVARTESARYIANGGWGAKKV